MTKAEFQKRVQTLPDTTRVQIVNCLAEAYNEVQNAERLLREAGFNDTDLPNITNRDTLRGVVNDLQQLFDFE